MYDRIRGAQSWYFELFWPHSKPHLNWGKPENISLLRQKNTNERDNNKTIEKQGWLRMRKINMDSKGQTWNI